jgi:putative membrane protein
MTPSMGVPMEATDPRSSDQRFIDTAAMCSYYEIEASRLALMQQGLPNEIADAARQVIDDHTAAIDGLKLLALRRRFSFPERIDSDHQRQVERLGVSSGDAFATDYLAAQLRVHEEAIHACAEEAKRSHDGDLREFAKRTLPVLKSHRSMFRSLPYAKAKSWWRFMR